MKISRISFAALLVLAAACSGDVTSSDPAQLTPAAASQSQSADAPDSTPAETEESPTSGLVGSSGG
jgi:hypothetical protein